MDRTGMQDLQITEGTDVYGSDGEKVGSVVAVQPNYVVVEKGFFFPTDYYVPTSAIASSDGGQVYLNVTKDEALNQGWDAEPTGGDAADVGDATTTAAYGTDAVAGTASLGGTSDLWGEAAVARGAAPEVTRIEADEAIVVPIHEEELTATTREREIGEVRIEKSVVAEERTIEVPVTEERVRVKRRAVDRPVDAADATVFAEGVIEVPIRGEEVELQTRVRVAEEVEVDKEAVQRTEQVSGTVRREEVRVDQEVTDATTTTGRTDEADVPGGSRA